MVSVRRCVRVYPTRMKEIGWGRHALILLSMVIVLWAGGDYVEGWFGHRVRSVAELVLIFWYLTAIAGMRFLPPRRNKDDEQRR